MKKMMLLAIAFLLVVSCNSKVEKKDIVEKPISKDKLMIKIENQLKIKLSQRANETLEKERELVESISEIQGEISSTLDTKKIFFILLKRIKELFDFDSALVLLKREKKYGF